MKNNKIKLGLVTLLMSSSLLVGCNSGPNIGPEPKPHEHSLTVVEAKEATYYQSGNIKYYYCPACNKKFSDSAATIEVSDADIILKKKTILEETTEVSDIDDPILKEAQVENGDKKFVLLQHDNVYDQALYVSRDLKDDYSTISFNFSSVVSNITYLSFDYRYLDNCSDREYDMLGHSFLTKKLDGEIQEHTFVPHSSDKLNKDCAWHTFEYKEANNLEGDINSLKVNIWHFNGELVISNLKIIHLVEGSTSKDPSTVNHYEDLNGNCYYYDYDSDEYILVPSSDVEIAYQKGKEPTCEAPGYKPYYWCEYTRQYYSDKDGKFIITDLDAWKSKGGEGYLAPAHDLIHIDGDEPTCSEPGCKDYYECSKCHKYFEDAEGEKLIGDATALVEWKASGGKIEALGHVFGDDGVCTRESCGATIKDHFNLQEANATDLLKKVSLSGVGIDATDWTAIGDHVWGEKYDFILNKGIDFTFDMQFTQESVENSLILYVASTGRNETGFRFRFDYPSDKGVRGYIYNNLPDDNDMPGAGEQNGTKFIIPDVTVVDNTVTVRIVMTQYNYNPNRFNFALYVNGVKAVSPNAFALRDSVTFYSTPRKTIRFNAGAKVKIRESKVEDPKELVLANGDTIFGKKSDFSTPITLPTLTKHGYKFVGWFDDESNKVTTVSSLNKKMVVKPVFVKNQTNMYLLSDFQYDTKEGKTIHPKGEFANTNPNLPTDATRIDTYFIMNPTFVTTDSYFFFGIPYDFIKADTRVQVRVALNASNPWYWQSSCSTIGGASEATKFKPIGLTWTTNTNYLIHVFVENTNIVETPYRFGFEVTNLADLTYYFDHKEFKFNTEPQGGYSIGDINRNRFSFLTDGAFGDADFSVTDAW